MGCCMSTEYGAETSQELSKHTTVGGAFSASYNSSSLSPAQHVSTVAVDHNTSDTGQSSTSSPSHLVVPQSSYRPSNLGYSGNNTSWAGTSSYSSNHNGQSGSSLSFGSYSVTDTAGSSYNE